MLEDRRTDCLAVAVAELLAIPGPLQRPDPRHRLVRPDRHDAVTEGVQVVVVGLDRLVRGVAVPVLTPEVVLRLPGQALTGRVDRQLVVGEQALDLVDPLADRTPRP